MLLVKKNINRIFANNFITFPDSDSGRGPTPVPLATSIATS